ncbi:MAG TPA: SRPBCC family protein [Actinocrinis sp.]|nr:SRPBCC family protein [Actinocrinis sp.]
MTVESKQISVQIDRPVTDVYDYLADPANMAEWAQGLGSTVTEEAGNWYLATPEGRIGVEFAPRNDFGVLDHDVTLPSGEVFYNPMRAVANEEGSEVLFTVRRLPGLSDAEFERDAGLVAADLVRIKQVLEQGSVGGGEG